MPGCGWPYLSDAAKQYCSNHRPAASSTDRPARAAR